MIKKLLLPFLLLIAISAGAQLNNSWIDYSKTYYKFKIAADNLCRIPQATLATAGIGSANANDFQLWRNGKQVRLFTSVAAAPLGTSDFIEFWGEMNDGKPDATLYKEPQFQLADRYSLETDTAVYFLTVNTAGGNLRYNNAANTAPSAATPDAYFMRKIDLYYRTQVCRGYADGSYGEYVHSAAYDNGEGLTSEDITYSATDPTQTRPLSINITDLNVYTAGPANGLSLRAKLYSNTFNNSRTITTKFFGTPVDTRISTTDQNNNAHTLINLNNLSLSLLQNTSNLPITIANSSPSNPSLFDRVVLATLGITYPATFNFNNLKSFYFELAPSAGNYLVIDNFNYGTVAPVLYDVNNGRRYIGDIASTPGKVKFVLPTSTGEPTRKFLLNNVEPAAVNTVSSITTKNFINYNTAANRGDYIIISNPALYDNGAGINYVEMYRAYRSTANGGGFNAKICDIKELTDQFGFGIKSHPTAVRDFVRFMDVQYPVKPKFIFLMGRGLSYQDKKFQESNPIAEKLDLVSTFGWPPSDILLVAQPTTAVPITPVGRLGAINGTEVGYYYQKVVQYEDAQRLQSPKIENKAWMKNTMQIVGGKTDSENNAFNYYMDEYGKLIKDTLFGGQVDKFNKTSSATIQQATNERIAQLFREGLGFIGYFGHSSASTFEFNLSNPEVYNNVGKYPFFNASGCTAGNYYNFDPSRLLGVVTLSDKYVLADQRGSIGFLADTHFGLGGNLHNYNTVLFQDITRDMYGKTIGEQTKDVTIKLNGLNSGLDHINRIHLEEINLHGDPAIKINSFPKPDYAIEKELVKISPSVITVADGFFNVKVEMRNIGKAINDSMRVYVKRLLPNTTVPVTIKDTMIFAIRNIDSLNLTIPINPATDKGLNKLFIKLDYTNRIPEIYETNNELGETNPIEFFIFENTLNPVYPYNYSIVNTQNITFAASTANPLIGLNNYVMEIDTTELFTSPFKKTYNKSGIGGAIEFTPTNITFADSVVYYWRTAVIPATGNNIWNSFSFIYLPNSTAGFNQSHYFQHLKSKYDEINLAEDRKFRFNQLLRTLTIKTGLHPSIQYADINLSFGAFLEEGYGCRFNSIQFYVLDSLNLAFWQNETIAGSGKYGSWPLNTCGVGAPPIRKFFEYPYYQQSYRKAAMDFLDIIPNGMYVAVTNLGNANSNTTFINDWKVDTATYGSGNSLYHKLKGIGFTKIDSFYRNIPFIYFFKKGSTTFPAIQNVGLNAIDPVVQAIDLIGISQNGSIESPVFGPVKRWNSLHWKGKTIDPGIGDSAKVEVWGIKSNGVADLMATVTPALDTSIAFIDAKIYPNIKLKLNLRDFNYATPLQLKYLLLNGDYVAEGAVAPNVLFTMKDTVEVGEPINFSVAFKNVSTVKFDSLMKISLRIRTNNNYDSVINIPKGKILIAGDTLKASYTIPSENYIGNNTLFIDFNPNNDQPEQSHFNNILYKDFFVRSDKVNPLLDVTFDGVHILGGDIVAAKPDILIKLKDESKFLTFRMQDTGLLKVQLRFPDQTLHNYYFNTDTMRFTPANIATGENTASINLRPYLLADGDYELIVTGKDRSGNSAGSLDYHTVFTVINKAMISELLNYPNPFTTSTAFVFTLTGSQVPQNLRIQILTITGKVVREITKADLGAIHVGRNITDFKWDGTDMYGQQLANGVYIYRVITNLNGKSLEKYKADGDDTNKYFNKGYGKMYLMR